jgi:hypothetical protein
MRAAQLNEVEERRVIRLLVRMADDVPALGDDEIQRALGSASVPARIVSGHVRSRRPARCFSAVAAAAMAAFALLAQLDAPPAERSSSAASGTASAAAFPEGSALGLLLSASETTDR